MVSPTKEPVVTSLTGLVGMLLGLWGWANSPLHSGICPGLTSPSQTGMPPSLHVFPCGHSWQL